MQSFYANEYVKNVLNVPEDRLFWLSDYLNYNFLNMDGNNVRDDFVLFNPRKGYERTSRLIQKSASDIKWVALSGFTPEEIPQVLQCAKVYIDFGEHPGKDRFPREAVCCGCRVITGKKGAAANDLDVAIPKKFKVDDDLDDERILDLIRYLIENYDETEEMFKDYKVRTKEEFHTFEADVLSVFSKLTGAGIKGIDLNETALKSLISDEAEKDNFRTALYLITVYRLQGFTVDEDMKIMESRIRRELGEEQAATYLCKSLAQSS